MSNRSDDNPPPAPPLNTRIGYQLRRATAVAISDFSDAFAASGLRPTQYAALTVIADRDSISQGELAKAIGMLPPNVARMISELVQAGFVVRTADPGDRRVQILTLTDVARERLSEWHELTTRHEDRFLQPLNAEERRNLTDLLQRIWTGVD